MLRALNRFSGIYKLQLADWTIDGVVSKCERVWNILHIGNDLISLVICRL